MKGRVFKAKRGHYIKKEEVKEKLIEIFEDFEKKGDGYIVRNYKAFDKMEIEVLKNKNKKNKLRVYTEASMEKADLVPETKSDLNDFLEEITGYTAKERRKRMKDSVEG